MPLEEYALLFEIEYLSQDKDEEAEWCCLMFVLHKGYPFRNIPTSRSINCTRLADPIL